MSYWFQKTIQLKARSEGCYLITDEILSAIGSEIKKIEIGLCNIFLLHTSAGLILNENWDSSVQKDMNNFFNRLVPK
jgi:secondary thiamine-phosphate synthase enzyme